MLEMEAAKISRFPNLRHLVEILFTLPSSTVEGEKASSSTNFCQGFYKK